MSEKLTVAELMARNAKDGARRADRPRRRRNLEDGGVSVSELTGSIPVVSDEDLGQDGAVGTAEDLSPADADTSVRTTADRHPHQGGHELDGQDVVEGEVIDEYDEAEAFEETEEPEEVENADGSAEVGQDERGVVATDTGETPGGAGAGAAETTVLPRVDARTESTVGADTGAEPEVSHDAELREDAAGEAESVESVESVEQTVSAEEQADGQAETDPDKVIEYEDDAISWPALLGQTALAVVIGVVIFFGFTLLWDKLGTALVLVMSGIVTLVCVGVVHALLRHRHTLVLILAFIVGLVITLGPRLIMSI